MDYNGLYKGLILLKLTNGEYVPLASPLASYGPFSSLSAAKEDLIDTFGDIENVPRGYTFCIIESSKPQEYWFTKEGDWSSIEKKNTSSSSSSSTVDLSDIVFQAANGYIQVSTDGGDTWTNIVALETLRGYKGEKGDTGSSANLSNLKLQISTTSEEVDGVMQYVNVLKMSINGGITWTIVGTIYGGGSRSSSSGVIGIATYTDGNKYWTLDGEWLLDDENNMVRANGIDGQDGADGTSSSEENYAQFKSIVFLRAINQPARPTGGTYDNPMPTSATWYDGIPSGEYQLWVSSKWFFKNEALNDDNINQWSEPQPATDTADLDFEYCNAALDASVGTPNTNAYDATTNPTGWYDADDYPALLEDANWMAMRVKRNGVWGNWTIWKIRGENGASPNTSYKSIIFKRSNNVNPTDDTKLATSEYPGLYVDANGTIPVDYAHPVPYGWSDGIPSGDEILWMSTRILSSDGESPQQSGWTTPQRVADGVNGYDFEWCDEETPTYPYPTRTSPDDDNSGKQADDTWYDEPSNNSDPIWMAVRHYEGGVYTDTYWTVMRVKGEAGVDGTSFVAKGQLFGIFASLAAARSYYASNSSAISSANNYAIVATDGTVYDKLYRFTSTTGTDVTSSLSIGDAFINVNEDQDTYDHIFIWDGDSFVDFGNIQGPEGIGTYFHIKYSNDGGSTFTSSNGETPGDYIGVRVDHVATDSSNPSDYIWKKWKGEDGFGYEYVFKLTRTSTAPSLPTLPEDYLTDSEYQDDDYIPDTWTDDPDSPSSDYPYCWVVYRRKVDGVWQAWKGQESNPTKAALFSRWASDGIGVSGVTEYYAVGTSKDTAPALSTFSTSIPSFDPDNGLIYLWNYEVTTYSDSSTNTTDPVCIGAYIHGVGIARIVEYYYAGSSEDVQNCPTYYNTEGTPTTPPASSLSISSEWKLKSSQVSVNKDTPYLWNWEIIWYEDGKYSAVEPQIIGWYTYTDIEYLTNIFEKVEGDSSTAYLGGLIGVTDDDKNVLAMLNATDIGEDDEHGKLFIASGMEGLSDVENATFKVYEDGHVEAVDVELSGYLEQRFRREIDITSYASSVKYISSPANLIALGWYGLAYTDSNNESVSFDTDAKVTLNLNSYALPGGKVILSNNLFMDSAGNMHFNSNRGYSILRGIFIMPNGTICTLIRLYGGWIELLKYNFLDANKKEITDALLPQTITQAYLVTGFGGEVYNEPAKYYYGVTGSGQVVSQISNNEERYEQRVITFSDSNRAEIPGESGNYQCLCRVYPTNKYFHVNFDDSATGADSDDDEFFIILPTLWNSPMKEMKFIFFFTPPVPIIKIRTANLETSIDVSDALANLNTPNMWGNVQMSDGSISYSSSYTDTKRLMVEITKIPGFQNYTSDESSMLLGWTVEARWSW